MKSSPSGGLLGFKTVSKSHSEYDLKYDFSFFLYYFPKIINLQQKYF